MLSSIFFIVNTRIGSEKIAAFTKALLNHLVGYTHEVHMTEYGGHALKLAEQALAQKSSLVVAVGGDGTVNEVLQAMVYSGIPMAIVPTGSGNGLARHCGIPIDIDKAMQMIVRSAIEKIDIGKANETYFISNAGVGYDAWICHRIKESKHRGLKMYVREVVKNYFAYSRDTYKIIADGVEMTHKAFFLNVANGKEFGYGFQIAPDASLQDGLLDLILVKKINVFNGLRFVWDGWNKKLHLNNDCIHLKAKRIEIESVNELKYYQTDGDGHECNGKCVFEIYPKSLYLLVPSNGVKL